MLIVSKVLNRLTAVGKWFNVLICYLILFAVVAGVIFRLAGKPIVGSDELVEILLVFTIMLSLAYTQSVDGHIKIDIITSKFPQKWRTAIDLISYFVTAVLSFIVAYVFFVAAVDNYVNKLTEVTMVLRFPLFILKGICAAGFLLWGLEALNKIIITIFRIPKLQIQMDKGESG